MEPILCHLDDAVMVLSLNRQNKRNALTQHMYSELCHHLERANDDPSIKAILFQGQTDCFCAGNDLHDFLNLTQLDQDTPVIRFLRLLPRINKPMLAAVAGPAVGIGTTLLLHCDLIVATADSKLALPFVNLGIVPEAGSSTLLPALVGYQKAAELLLLGKPFSGEQAHQWGLINQLCPAETLLETALGLAHSIARKPPLALADTLSLLRHARPKDLTQVVDREIALFTERVHSDEARAIIAGMVRK
ncbi:enoyl-CoA hydratase-related protein [Ferrimonas pelagia]|uniref:Enoyl-CoA hydratase n=1 Tax=Ferrimonas pelagia TaxID=1177826 RepID=A0ABP9EP28_9GAMM